MVALLKTWCCLQNVGVGGGAMEGEMMGGGSNIDCFSPTVGQRATRVNKKRKPRPSLSTVYIDGENFWTQRTAGERATLFRHQEYIKQIFLSSRYFLQENLNLYLIFKIKRARNSLLFVGTTT